MTRPAVASKKSFAVMGAICSIGYSAASFADDKEFFEKAAIGGMTEVEAGKLAVSQGSTDDVKLFGQRMVDDHTKANDQLKALAETKGVTLPSAPDAKHDAMMSALKAKQGKSFDTAFIDDMKKGHAEAITAFTAASKSKDSEIAQFASTTLPTLKDHQAHIPMASLDNGPSVATNMIARISS